MKRRENAAMVPMQGAWQFWAVLSAIFAALTAIFAKVENVNSDFATLVRTLVILAVVAAILKVTRHWQAPGSISPRSYALLVLSGIATGLIWLCYYRALQVGSAASVAPVNKQRGARRPVRRALPSRQALRGRLSGHLFIASVPP